MAAERVVVEIAKSIAIVGIMVGVAGVVTVVAMMVDAWRDRRRGNL